MHVYIVYVRCENLYGRVGSMTQRRLTVDRRIVTMVFYAIISMVMAFGCSRKYNPVGQILSINTSTVVVTSTNTKTPVVLMTATKTQTQTPTQMIPTVISTSTRTSTASSSNIPTSTSTRTNTPVSTVTGTAPATSTRTVTRTQTAYFTHTCTGTATATPTVSPVVTVVFTPSSNTRLKKINFKNTSDAIVDYREYIYSPQNLMIQVDCYRLNTVTASMAYVSYHRIDYNANGTIAKIMTYADCHYDGLIVLRYEMDYNYDAGGKLIRIDTLYPYNGTGPMTLEEYAEFTYDAGGKLQNKTVYSNCMYGSFSYFGYTDYTYNAGNKILKEDAHYSDSCYYSNGGTYYYDYFYDAGGKMINSKRYNFETSSYTLRRDTTYTYDASNRYLQANENIIDVVLLSLWGVLYTPYTSFEYEALPSNLDVNKIYDPFWF